MTLLASFNALLSYYSGEEDIVLGSPTANRNRPEISSLIGFFINTLALRTDLSGDPTFTDLLSRVRDVALGAYAHQHAPFEEIVRILQPERSSSHTPLFQVTFSLQNAPMPNSELPGLILSQLEFDTEVTLFDMMLDVWEIPEGIQAVFRYATDLFHAATIARMAERWERILCSVVEQPDIKLSALAGLLVESEKQAQVKQKKQLDDKRLQKLEAIKRRSERKVVSLSENELITTRLLAHGSDLPLIITPAASGMDLEAWAASNRDFIEASLLKHGGILFRGFDVTTASDFRRLISVLSSEPLEYNERSSPRRHVADNIYTSTEYPPDQKIFLHNENSYQQSWPLKLFFFCEIGRAHV